VAGVAATTPRPPSALPFTDLPVTDPASAAAYKAELPSTGTNDTSLALLGTVLVVVVVGLILTPAESRRRASRRITGWIR
jgi:LPXTG-motif cell wall-anchored protein